MAATGMAPPRHFLQSPHETYVHRTELALSDFEMIGALGTGGCGTVFKVRHRGTYNLYALKAGHEGDDRTAAEADVLSRCAGAPNIVRCHSVFRTAAGNVALLLDLMEGGSLERVLGCRRRCFSESALADVAAQALQGLLQLHCRGIVHLDVKPANLVTSASGAVKICDLGLAKVLDHHSGDALAFAAGSLEYMSPERFFPEPYAGCCHDAYAADVWSLGITMLELFLGWCPNLPPWRMYCRVKLTAAICFGPPPWLPASAASPEFLGFVAACLQKDPKKRPSVAQLLQHPFVSQRDVAESRRELREVIWDSL